MGQSSSQVQDEAPDASQLQRAGTPTKGDDHDDAAASSQLVSETQTAAVPTPEKQPRERKGRKAKKEKRKSRDSVQDAEQGGNELAEPRAAEAASGEDAAGALTRPEDARATQPAPPEAPDPKVRESRKKNKKDRSSRKEPAEAAEALPATASATEQAEEDKASSKKRKRKSAEVPRTETADASQPTVEANLGPAQEDKDAEDQSRKKHKKSTRASAASAPAQIKNTPIPIPTFNPPAPKQSDASSSTRKSKRKSDADASKNKHTEDAPAPVAAPVTAAKESRSAPSEAQPAKDATKKQKKTKKSHKADGGNAAHPEDAQLQPTASSVELSVIDPALLPPAQQEAPAETQTAHTADDGSSRKKQKKSKKAQNSVPATQASNAASQDVTVADGPVSTLPTRTANGILGDPNASEVTGERAYIEHQKKKEKRKRQAETAASSSQAQPEASSEPKSKKRKKAADTNGAVKTEKAGSGVNGVNSKPQGTEDFPSSGPYTKKEVETLTRAIETYREYNDLTKPQVNDIVQAGVFNEVHGKSCKEFWDEVCPCLPNRWSRETIIKFVRRKWHNFDKRGKWDPEEDQMLKDAYARTPGQWTKIGEAVGRFADDCRDRWRNYLSCSDTMASKRWHDSEVNELLNVVQDCLNTLLERLPEDRKNYWREELQSTKSRDIWKPDEIRNLVRKMPDCMEALRAAFDEKHPREGKQKRATEKRRGSSATDGSVVINWDLVSEKMGKKRSRLQIMSKWKALEHTYSQDPKETFFTDANHWRVENGQKWAEQMLPGDKYNIVRAMMDLGLTNEERIIWNSVAHHDLVKLKWAHQAKMTFLSMKDAVPPRDSLPKLLESLKDYFETHHADELDSHWRYEGRPGRASLKSGTKSPGPLDWRGHMRGESQYKSSARVTDDDEGDEEGSVKAEQ